MAYEKEVVDQQARVDRMKSEGKDEYDIRKQVNTTLPSEGTSLCIMVCVSNRRRC